MLTCTGSFARPIRIPSIRCNLSLSCIFSMFVSLSFMPPVCGMPTLCPVCAEHTWSLILAVNSQLKCYPYFVDEKTEAKHHLGMCPGVSPLKEPSKVWGWVSVHCELLLFLDCRLLQRRSCLSVILAFPFCPRHSRVCSKEIQFSIPI